jgi:hypothetical protein
LHSLKPEAHNSKRMIPKFIAQGAGGSAYHAPARLLNQQGELWPGPGPHHTSMQRQNSGHFCSPQRPEQGRSPLQQTYLRAAARAGREASGAAGGKLAKVLQSRAGRSRAE